MVEKIIISPESIRGLGNIVMPKTGADFEEYNCTMEVGEDTVNGEDVTVYVLTPETTTISLVLSSNVSTVTAGGDVILSVTVTEDEVPVSGQSVSFKLGSTELGTSTTNSSGVATYTYTTTGSGSLNFSAVYAGHSSNGVSVVVNKRSTSTSLSLGSASIVVGSSTTATATVTSSSSGVSGLTVTFYDGSTSLSTATTNSSGVATYTLSGLGVGSHSITAVVTATDTYDTSTSSASTLTVLDHSYSLAFSAASYVATGGSATLECTLLDNNVPVEGATISVSGSDSSLYTGITNSNGIATVTVTGISATTTFTCTYSNVSDTCTVNTITYYINDDATADNSSTLFGSSIALRNNGANTTSWVSTGYYRITNTGSQKESMRVLAPLTGVTDDFVIEYDSYVEQTGGSSGFVIYNSSTAWEKLTDDADSQKKYWYGYNNGSFHETSFFGNATTYQKWVHYKFTVQGTTFKMEVTYNDSTVVTRTETIHFNRSSSTQYGLDCEWQSSTKTRYKNLVAYKI